MSAVPYFLPRKLLVAFSGIGIAMIIGLFYNAYQELPLNLTWLYIAIILNFIAFLGVILDLIKNNIPRKNLWVIGLILLPFFTTFIYLIARKDD